MWTRVSARLADFDVLIEAAHQRGLRVILDLVLNHTSDQHPWFEESRLSRDNPKSDWYIWQDSLPNDWQSVFGGRAWEWSPERGQYYYHMFVRQQPDVNWRNPQVRQAQLDVVRFWLERGADGFRLDVFNVYFKDDRFRGNPPRLGLRAFERQRHIYDIDRPELIPLLQELRGLLDRYPERYAVGETFLSEPSKIGEYVGPDRLHAAFDFGLTGAPFQAERLLGHLQASYELERRQGIWPTHVLSNHDVPRTATRHTRGEDDARAKVMMALLLTQRGTPFLYYGEELGMRDIRLPRSQIQDPPGKKYWPFYKGRDGCRAPMQWDGTQYAGFSTVQPWLPVHPDYLHRNVQDQCADPLSMLNFTRALIRLRRKHPALRQGEFILPEEQSRDALVYQRQIPGETLLVALNFKGQRTPVKLPRGTQPLDWDPLLSSFGVEPHAFEGDRLILEPYEACLLRSALA